MRLVAGASFRKFPGKLSPQRGVRAAVLCALALGAAACSSPARQASDTMIAKQPIELVLRTHTDSLMHLPGVVGTAIGLCDSTPCIKVLVARSTPELRRSVPDSLDGWRVVMEETGVIRPQDARDSGSR